MSLVPHIEKNKVKKLDAEWIELIKQAKRYGIKVEEIRDFLRKKAHR